MIYGKAVFLDTCGNVWFTVLYYIRYEDDGFRIVLEKCCPGEPLRETAVSDMTFSNDEDAERMMGLLVNHYITPCTLNEVLCEVG